MEFVTERRDIVQDRLQINLTIDWLDEMGSPSDPKLFLLFMLFKCWMTKELGFSHSTTGSRRLVAQLGELTMSR